MLPILGVVAFLAFMAVLPVVMVRGLIQMYRDKNRSGTFTSAIAGSITEIDRLVRPSVQHVIEAKQSIEAHEDAIGGQ
jgi:hypothetical protein